MILVDLHLDGALLGILDLLGLEARALSTHASRGVHSLLKRIGLPAKDVIGVLAQASGVSGAQHERLRSISRPISLVVELSGIPDNL